MEGDDIPLMDGRGPGKEVEKVESMARYRRRIDTHHCGGPSCHTATASPSWRGPTSAQSSSIDIVSSDDQRCDEPEEKRDKDPTCQQHKLPPKTMVHQPTLRCGDAAVNTELQ